MNSVTCFLPEGHPNRPGARIEAYNGLIIHYTANSSPGATAQMNANYFGRPYQQGPGDTFLEEDGSPFRYGSAHVIVDENGAVYCVPYDEVAWAVGDRELPQNNGSDGYQPLARDHFSYRQNWQSISIEICNNGDWDAAVANAIIQAAYLMKTYNIPIENVFRHWDVTGKNCPAPFVSNVNAWNDFRTRLAEAVTGAADNA